MILLTARRREVAAKFNVGSMEVALPFAEYLSLRGWRVEMRDTPSAVYLNENELCWNATLCGQYSDFLEGRKVDA